MGKNLRIFVVIAGFHPLVGGSETQCLAQCRGLQARGCEVTVITFRHDRSWARREVVEGVPVKRIAGLLLGKRETLPRSFQRLLYLLALVVLAWTLWRHRSHYDLIHLYNLGLLSLSCTLACRLTGKPLIVAVQGAGEGKVGAGSQNASLIAGPLDPSTPWLRVRGRSRVNGDLESLERLGKPVVRVALALLRSTRAVVVIMSSRMKHYLVLHDFLLSNVQLIPNGVNTARFAPDDRRLSCAETTQTVVCVSRLSYEKGIDVLLQAWHRVQKQAPQARLIIVGNGSLQPQLEQMAEALNITGSVEFAGLQHDVVAQLHRGSLAVLPSRIEGMPNALLEAMACGLSCVATRVSGSEDLIQHEVNGLLVEPEDYQSMAQALLGLISNPTTARKYGSAARATIEQHYSQEHIADMYTDLYESVVSKPADKRLRVLIISGHYPTEHNPHANTFIKTQVDSLIAAGVDAEVTYPGVGPFLWRYISTWARVFCKTLRGRYDIVHGHYGQWCLLARLQWTTPVVASFLGSDLLGDVTLEGRLTQKGKIITGVSRWLCRRVDAVTVKTEEMKKAARGNNVIVYSDGIDFELFRPMPRAEARCALGWDQDRYYVLFGNNPQRAVKNYPLALAAIETLRANGVPAELVVASGLSQTALVQYINASNALILSSISEGSPNIVKEAMACNVPVVSTNVGDVSEIIGHTEGCSVCPPDPASLAEALEKALRHREPTTGRTDIAHLEKSVIAKQIIAVYEQLVSKRQRIKTPLFEKEKAYGNNT